MRADVVGAEGEERRRQILLGRPFGKLPQIEAHLHPQPPLHDGDLVARHVVANRLAALEFAPVVGQSRRLLRTADNRRKFGRLAGGEGGGEGVVVARGDGIVLVVVAAGAGDRQPHQPAADDVDLVVEEVVAVAELHADGEEAETGQRRVVRGEPHLVGGNLLGDEPVPGDVAIERPHTVVAVGVGEGELREADGTPAVGVGIAGDVEPVAPPAFAVAGGGEEAIDYAAEGFAFGGDVGLEGLDLLPDRRQSREVERRPPDQFTPTDTGGLGQPTRLAGAGEEAVDVGAGRSGCGRDRRAADRGKRPVPLVRSAGCDPAAQRVDLGRRQARPLRRGRHAQVGIGGQDAANQLALVGATREHGLGFGPLGGI